MKKAVVWMIVVTFVAGMVGAYAGEEGEGKDKKRGKRRGPGGHEMHKKMIEKYDKDGDGKLSEEERAEAKKAWAEMHKERHAEMLKKYDKDGDGKLCEEERKAARAEWQKKRGKKGETKGECPKA